jgi:CPA1 family monovalent cation:H+ antiporter
MVVASWFDPMPEDERRDRPLHLFRQRARRGRREPAPDHCEHLQAHPPREAPVPAACEDHQPDDGAVVHLRFCLTCGHIGCCDSSRPQHATAHATSTGHPVMQSAEPGETWRWCYPDELLG